MTSSLFSLSRLFVLGVLLASTASAGNPILKDIFTADPSALVHDGVVYVYSGHDEAGVGDPNYRMKDWQCFSSSDLVHWTVHPSPLKVADFAWAKQDAWAGQVVERNGKFYWYVPVGHGSIFGFSIGVAVSDSPTGPFKDARGSALITNNMTTDLTIFWDDIDPSVIVDDDGQAYLFWGNTKCRYVKLKPNMTEVDGPIVTLSLPNFTEAPWVYKRGSTYYMTYAAYWPEKLAYATADKITGPWTYRGTFKEYAQNCGTNHQAIIDFKGRSYIIYHNGALPTGGDYRRSVCIDYLNYNADGTIQTVVETAEGVSPVVVANDSGPGRLTNLSVRGQVGTGSGVLITGFYVNGTTPETVVVRAVGPGLGNFGVEGALEDPILRVANRDGTTLASNDNWGGAIELNDAFKTVGAFPLDGASKDAALLVTLNPGLYSVVISGAGATTGISLAEVYALP